MTVVKYLFMHHKNVILAGTTVETSAVVSPSLSGNLFATKFFSHIYVFVSPIEK